MSFRRTIAALVLAAATCFGAGADGKWAGAIKTPDGAIPMKFEFKSEGKKLMGTMVGPQGEVSFQDGAVEGNLISFSVTYHVYDTDITFRYRGIISDDKIDFQMNVRQNEPTMFSVNRVK